jgi:hypothetical protein
MCVQLQIYVIVKIITQILKILLAGMGTTCGVFFLKERTGLFVLKNRTGK